MSNLTICKASAGSGKTHKLTGEYLKLIFNEKISFKNILAVTFTNKATTEMRERILSAIYDLAQGKESDYEEELCNEFNLSRKDLTDRAKRLLNQMLNQYSYFKISTIDSFFQQVIKSIAYELELDNNFTLELDDNAVVEQAVARLIDEFGIDSAEGKWLLQSISEKMEKGKRWEVQKEITEFVSKVFDKVQVQNSSDSSSSKIKDFSEFKKKLSTIVDDFIHRVNELGKEAIGLMERCNLTVDDFYQKGKGVGTYFKHCSECSDVGAVKGINSYVAKAIDAIEGWSKDNDIQQKVISSGLMDCLKKLAAIAESDDCEIAMSAQEVLVNINKYALVDKVMALQKEICEEQNLFLLRSAMPFLNKMIDNSDAPFIYEKFGYQLRHFMIDEFQDTSALNWDNLYPLINNGISEGGHSLIVGDVKQAIYRWRGGDWNLLDSVIQRQFNVGEVENLEYNWRSCENVIKFNNWCFNTIYRIISDVIKSRIDAGEYPQNYLDIFRRTYGAVEQKIPKNKAGSGGYVRVDYIEAANSEDYDNEVSNWLIEQVDRLSELGFQPGDIAILVRSNRQGTMVANSLAQAQSDNPEKAGRYKFVSSESVLLGNNQAIRLLVSAMQFLLTPDNVHSKGQLIWLYFAKNESLQVASEKIQQLDFNADAEQVWREMPAEFQELRESFRQLDIVQLGSRLIHIFFGMEHQIDASDMPYLNEFEDRVQAFSERNGSNLQQFVDWWNDVGFKQLVTMNDKQNAICITTIHKSKGLEFKSVIVPYLFSGSESKSNLEWCETDKEPFAKFSPLPINLKQSTANTIFRKSYFEDEFMKWIDSLNTIYVAFTRASVDMRVCVKFSNKESDKFSIVRILEILYNDFIPDGNVCVVRDTEKKCLSIGTESHYISTINNDIIDDLPDAVSTHKNAQIRIRCHSEDFFSGADFDQAKRINTGKLYHHIFENVKYADDVHNAVITVANEGLITPDEASECESKVAKFVGQQPDWFSNRWAVLTEQSIMLANGEIKRPDRILESDTEMVVIDYKFTSRHDEKYNEQVSIYVDALRKLTDKTVKGYLWYVWPNETVEVCG